MTASSKPLLTQRPLRLLLATVVLSLAAGVAQTAIAQGHSGPGARGMGSGGPGMGFGAPHQIERMLDAVNATAEQRAQIKQITQAAKADMQAQHEAGRKLQEQSQALFAQPTVDARAAEALRQQMLAQHDQASKHRLQVMLDVSRVLTPEQRKTLADRMAQRRALMERQRAEREAIDKPALR
jgi:Spy/CpxP family protein refolding chaperone